MACLLSKAKPPEIKYYTAVDAMGLLSFTDSFALAALTLSLITHLARKYLAKYFGPSSSSPSLEPRQASREPTTNTRDICKKIDQCDKNCVIFYGSQTGTAEKLALRLAKEGSSRFGLKTMMADLGDFDYNNLDVFSMNNIAMFVIATYGEGEPTDNAIAFHRFINSPAIAFKGRSEKTPLSSLNFVAFGLGNSTYQHYNSMVHNINRVLKSLGANRVGNVGKGDDGKGTLEEDFFAWKETMWQAVAGHMALREKVQNFQPAFSISEKGTMSVESRDVFLGEPNKNNLKGSFRGTTKGPYSSQNPFLATITESRELFSSTERNCLHIEVDIGNSTLAYETGDHLAVWPMNSNLEVDWFLDVFDLSQKRNTIVSVNSVDSTLKVPFPSTTTYETAIRYYLNMCAPVSRLFLSSIVPFVADEPLKTDLSKLSGDKFDFQENIARRRLNIAQAIQLFAGPSRRISVPFSLLVENLNRLQPRFYSISSSARTQRKKISITAVVESRECSDTPYELKGVCTNYLLALHQHRNQSPATTYQISGPRNRYGGSQILIHLRPSKFRLPTHPTIPIVMIVPGTGVAPFRAFVQERVSLFNSGQQVGRTLLFFGCRQSTEDFIYESEWTVSLVLVQSASLADLPFLS